MLRAAMLRSRDPTLNQQGWRSFCSQLFAEHHLSAKDSAPICLGFEERQKENSYIYGRIICSHVGDYWNIRRGTHQSPCECYLQDEHPRNWDEFFARQCMNDLAGELE